MTMSKGVPFLIIPALLITLLGLIFIWQPEKGKTSDSSFPVGGGFTLNSAIGEVTLKDFHGKVVLIYFGYSWCPDICPTNLAYMGAAFKKLDRSELELVQGIFVSVDPERDSIEHLKEYSAFFGSKILGVTGQRAMLDDLVRRYGAAYQITALDSAVGYVVDHTSETYLVDTKGNLKKALPHATDPADIAEEIRRLLAAQ